MRIAGFLVLLFSTAALGGPITTASSVDDVLDALDARGKDMKSLSADVKMITTDSLGGDDRTLLGRLYYEKRADGDSRFHARFDKSISGKQLDTDKKDWVYSDGLLVDRNYHLKKQSTHQVLRPGEKMELFKLQGPFPLPLGQDKADVHKSFDVKRIELKKDEPAGTVHLTLTPMKGTDLAKRFMQIDLYVDPASSLPVRIDATDSDGATTKENFLTNAKVNESIPDEKFQLETIDLKKAGWDETDDRFH
jgi:outer membrane lipoprotein-sorting protein